MMYCSVLLFESYQRVSFNILVFLYIIASQMDYYHNYNLAFYIQNVCCLVVYFWFIHDLQYELYIKFLTP